MSDEFAAVLGMVAALNPAAAAVSAGRPIAARIVGTAVAAAAAVMIAVIVLADAILDGISVAPASFQVAAGIVMIVSAAQVMLYTRATHEDTESTRAAIYPLAIPMLAGPALVVLGMSVSATESIGLALGGAALALALGGGGLLVGPRTTFGTAARFIAVGLIVLGVGEIVDGVKSV